MGIGEIGNAITEVGGGGLALALVFLTAWTAMRVWESRRRRRWERLRVLGQLIQGVGTSAQRCGLGEDAVGRVFKEMEMRRRVAELEGMMDLDRAWRNTERGWRREWGL